MKKIPGTSPGTMTEIKTHKTRLLARSFSPFIDGLFYEEIDPKKNMKIFGKKIES